MLDVGALASEDMQSLALFLASLWSNHIKFQKSNLGICIAPTQPFQAALGAESRVCYLGNTADRQHDENSRPATSRSQQQIRTKSFWFTATAWNRTCDIWHASAPLWPHDQVPPTPKVELEMPTMRWLVLTIVRHWTQNVADTRLKMLPTRGNKVVCCYRRMWRASSATSVPPTASTCLLTTPLAASPASVWASPRCASPRPGTGRRWVHHIFPPMGRVIQVFYFPYPFSLPGPQTFRVFTIQPLLFRDFYIPETDKPSRWMFPLPNPQCFAPLEQNTFGVRGGRTVHCATDVSES
jgi:hypothetical protein